MALKLKNQGLSVSPLDPTGMPDLVAWYKADSLALSNGATVTNWPDDSPRRSGNDLNNYGGTPTYNSSDPLLGGMPSVTYDGLDWNYRSNPTGLPVGSSAHTTYVVGYWDGTPGGHAMFAWGNNAYVGCRLGIYYFAGGMLAESLNIGSKVRPISSNTPFIFSFPYVAGANYSASTTYLGGVGETGEYPGAPGVPNIVNPVTEITIGYPPTAGGERWTGAVAEVLVFNTTHNEVTRGRIERYLANKYGIPITPVKIAGSFVSKGSGGGFKTKISPPPPFSPLSISGLVGWYDASDVSTFTFETISSLSQVTVWNDKSGQGNHATRNATRSNPVVRLSLGGGGVAFPEQVGHSEWLQTNLMPPTGSNGRTIITVVSNPADGEGYIWSYGTPYNPAPSDNIYALTANTFDQQNVFGGVGTTKYGVVTAPTGLGTHDQMISTESSEFQVGRARKIISTRYNGTTNVIKAGLSTVSTATVTLNTGNAQGFRIGNRVATYGTPSKGNGMVIHEILVYDRDLTDAEWDTAINGLDAKWSAYSFGSTLCPNYGRLINDVDLSTITSSPATSTFTFPSDYITVSLVTSNFRYLHDSQESSNNYDVAAFAMTLTQAGTYQFDSSRSGAGFFGNTIAVYEQTCPNTKTTLAGNSASSSTVSTSYVYAGGAPKNIIVEGAFIGIGDTVSLTVTKTA